MLNKLLSLYPNRTKRIFEVLPGLALWMLLTSPIWMSFHLASLIGNLVIIFAVYWLYRSIIFVYALYVGYTTYKKAEKTNWLALCKKLDFEQLPNPETLPVTSKLPKFLVVIPVGSAKYKETLKYTLKALDKQNYPQELIHVSLSFEERLIEQDKEYFKKIKNLIKSDFKDWGNRLMIFDHPKNLPGEVIGAAANRTWGTREAVKILERDNQNIKDFLIISPDEDLRFHKEYLGAIAYEYLINEKRLNRFYQTAIYRFDNNYWESRMIIRVWSMSLTMPILASSITDVHRRETWSCFALNLWVMKEVNYWDTSLGIDDTPFYWRPFDYFNGDFECSVFFVPHFADTVYHPDRIENYKAQFRQLVRWGWGVITFPVAMRVLLKNKKIPIIPKIKKMRYMFETLILFKLAAIILSVSIPLVNIINPALESSQVISSSVPQTLSTIMTILLFMSIPAITFKFLLIPPYPKRWGVMRRAITFLLEIPLHGVILYTYGFIPFLVGPTLMLLGKKYTFVVTKKH